MGGLTNSCNGTAPCSPTPAASRCSPWERAPWPSEIKGNRNKPHDNKSLLKISEEGTEFRSYVDGSKIKLTPESAMEIQRKLGADLLMQLSDTTPYHATKDYTARSMEMSMRWGDRCLAQSSNANITASRRCIRSCRVACTPIFAASAPNTPPTARFGTAIGGCLGGTDEEMLTTVAASMPFVNPSRPVHFLGIGRIKTSSRSCASASTRSIV